MLATPIDPAERRLSEIDRFCIQTQETGKQEAARRVRFFASTLGALCLALLACLAVALLQVNAVARERDALADQLRSERAARIKTTLAAKDTEMSAATYALDTQVRRDIVDQRMVEQERRSAELARLAEQVERQKLAEADCVTPRSIMVSAGL
ncbi:MAG TPA: hypothetical protein VFS49_11165 [Croceibacterium sp.]|nr:hypothetical protein [Croceibacterium sp.]